MICAGFTGPSGERYDTPEDTLPKHVRLRGHVMPSDGGATVYDSYFDAKSGGFKLWDSMLSNEPIPSDAEVCRLSRIVPLHGCSCVDKL